jgi:two-component system LytT family response regulator
MSIRALIVDDEPLARRGIRTLLVRNADVEVVAECSNTLEAVHAIKAHAPNLVFLDVQMPGQSGFDVIESIEKPHCPYFVLVTAFDDFAIRAFDVQVFDYLLKPINERRFDLTLNRVRSALSNARDGFAGRMPAALAVDADSSSQPIGPAQEADRIPVRAGGRVVVIRIAEVDWVKAERDFVSLHVGPKIWLVRETISVMEARFASAGFVRIHRSTLVNVDRVKELRPLDKGEYQVILRDGAELKLSRNYRAALPRLAGASL